MKLVDLIVVKPIKDSPSEWQVVVRTLDGKVKDVFQGTIVEVKAFVDLVNDGYISLMLDLN